MTQRVLFGGRLSSRLLFVVVEKAAVELVTSASERVIELSAWPAENTLCLHAVCFLKLVLREIMGLSFSLLRRNFVVFWPHSEPAKPVWQAALLTYMSHLLYFLIITMVVCLCSCGTTI